MFSRLGHLSCRTRKTSCQSLILKKKCQILLCYCLDYVVTERIYFLLSLLASFFHYFYMLLSFLKVCHQVRVALEQQKLMTTSYLSNIIHLVAFLELAPCNNF